jgi:hypothetical protein
VTNAYIADVTCRTRAHRPHWVVVHRRCNYSAFNGYRYTPSDYSLVHCTEPSCRKRWRTKAAYVDTLPNAESSERS